MIRVAAAEPTAMAAGEIAGAGDGVVARGAEAMLTWTSFVGRHAIAKHRIPKGYRHDALDAVLRDERTRDEARLLGAARAAGVPVPLVFDIDRAGGRLVIEAIEGEALRDVLPADDDATAAERMRAVGALTAHLHDAGLTHGDLTTSNILVPDASRPDSLVFIDFGLGGFNSEEEDKAVDLHLIEEALEATDDRVSALWVAAEAGYTGTARDAAPVLRRLEAVRQRGRYRGAG